MGFSVESMCRTCMNEGGTLFSILSSENQYHTNFADMLMACTSIHINSQDGMPQQICIHCLKRLLVAFSFKQQSEQCEATLREITKNPDIEFIKEEVSEPYEDIGSFIDAEANCDVFSSHWIEPSRKESLPVITSSKGTGKETPRKEPKKKGNQSEMEIPPKEIGGFLSDDFILDDSDEFLEDDDDDDLSSLVDPLDNDLERIKLSILKPRARPTILQQCTVCKLRFRSAEAFREHKKIHAKKLECELCGKEFKSTHGLRYHVKIHQGIKNYACHFENCGKKFRLKQALDKHLSIHNNEKNHLCSLCGKTYSTYDSLHYHLKAHKGERPYLCIHCGKTFKQSCHLKVHMWVHNGIKPYMCKSCGKCYTTGHQLKKHLKKYCLTDTGATNTTNNPPANNITVEVTPESILST